MKTSRIEALNSIAASVTKKLPDAGHTHTRKLQAEVARLARGLAGLEQLSESPNPVETSAAHQKRIASGVKKYIAEVAATNDRLNEIIHKGLLEIDTRIAQKVKLVPDSFAQEIRSAFRSMGSADRIKLLNQLAIENRGPELAAIVKAPAILTGIDAALQNQYAELIVQKHAPDEYAEQYALLDGFNAASVAIPLAKNAANAFADPIKLAVIERGEAKAQAADAAFANAFSQGE